MRAVRGPVTVPVPANGPMRPPTGGGGLSPFGPTSAPLAPLGMRPPSSAGLLPVGMRPPTSSAGLGTAGGARPSSGAFRPPTGSAQSNPSLAAVAGPIAGGGLSLDAGLSVRPVTSAGLTGAGSGRPLGPARQVADKSFWQSELRSRLAAISAEGEHLRAEQATIAAENAAYSALERRYEASMKEVRGLEGQLADHNLALDKLRTHSSVDEVASLQQRLQASNAALRGEADALFLSAGQQSVRREELTQAMERLEAEAQTAVRVLGEERLAEFDGLHEERRLWRQRRRDKADRLRTVQAAIARATAFTASDEGKRKVEAGHLNAALTAATEKAAELTSDLSLASNPAALKERLTSSIKGVNEEVQRLEGRRADVEAELDGLSAAVKELEAEKDSSASALQQSGKFAAIKEREHKMTQLIQQQPQLTQQIATSTQQLQRQVVATLTALSAERQKGRQIGDAAALTELSAEVSFKAGKLKSSAETLAVLQKERQRRVEELDKIGHLDVKITAELAGLRQQMADMRADVAGFRSEEQWKAFHTAEKRRLTQANAALQRDIAALQGSTAEAVAALGDRQRSLAAALQANGSNVAAKEAAWQALASTVAALDRFVEQRQRETDYTAAKQATLQLVTRINAQLTQRQPQQQGQGLSSLAQSA